MFTYVRHQARYIIQFNSLPLKIALSFYRCAEAGCILWQLQFQSSKHYIKLSLIEMFCLLWTKHKITVILDKSHHSSFPKSIKLAHFTNIRWRITHDKWQIWKYQGKQKNVKGYLLNWATLPLSTLWPGKKIIIYPTCIMHFYFNSLACVSVILFLIFSSDG